MRVSLLATALMIAPGLAATKPPLPQLKPCVAIDEAAMIKVVRFIDVVHVPIFIAKSDYQRGKAEKKEIYDRLPVEPEVKRSER